MSTTIDQRVVEMRFDNAQFEKNVSTTMSSLEKLQKGLNLPGATKGLEGVGNAAKKVDLSGLSDAAQTVGLKFNAMYTIADQALRNITNSAMNAGRRIMSALTVDPIKTGLQEYETQINAVQTIMANTESKGTTLDDVNKALDELNTYADKTIYNFTEMTRNIGTFTAAGVDLDTSVKSIQGIANLAAVSGSTSQQASTAMYQLSQALAAGKVSLMDWNSVVNAGIGGQVFQDALKRTAKNMGKDVDGMIKKYGSFRESLTQGEWLTAEVLTKTLEQFTMSAEEGSKQWNEFKKSLMDDGYTEKQAEEILKMANTATSAATKVKTFTQLWDTLKETAQSGWTQTWEILLGDFEEAKSLFSELYETLSPVLEASAKARNELLQGWKDKGGRDHLLESMRNLFESISSVVKPIKEAFRDIFPPITVKQLLGFTEGLQKLTEKLILGKTASDNLKRTFKGLFAIVDIVRQVFGGVFKAISPLFGGLDNVGGGLLGFTAKLGDAIVEFDEFIKKGDVFGKAGDRIATALETAYSKVKTFISIVKENFKIPGLEVFQAFIDRVSKRMEDVKEAASGMKSGVTIAIEAMGAALANSDFIKLMQTLWNGIKTIGSGLAKAFGALTGGLVDKIGNANFSGIFDLVNTISLGGIALFVTKFVKGFSDVVESAGSFKDSILETIDSVRGCFEAYQTQLKAGALLKIASAIAILAGSILILSFIDSEKLSASLGAITVLFADLMGSMALFEKFGGETTGIIKSTTAMIGVSIAVFILAGALKKISDLDLGDMAKGLGGIMVLTGTIVGAAKILSSGKKKVLKGAVQMVIFAAAIKILASVCKDLASLSWEELGKGLIGVSTMMGAISLFLRTAKFSGKAITTATGIVILSSAIKILASACEDFGQMSWESIGKGLAGIGALLLEVSAFTRLTGNAKHVMSSGVALIAIGAAMKIFASAMSDMSGLSWEGLAKGLSGMAGALLAITLAVNFMPKNMVGAGVGLIGIATAMIILSEALNRMGGMSWESIAKSLVSLGGSMLILAAGLNFMKGTISGSAALLVAVTAIAALTPVLLALGGMSWESIAKGLVTIAGAFVVIGLAGLVLKPLVPAILGLAGSMALMGLSIVGIGAGLVLAGVGLSAIAIGFTALATAVAGGATAIVSALSVILMGIINLIPAMHVKWAEGVIAFAAVIAEGAPVIGEAVKAIVLSLVDVLIECVPAIADGALKLIAGILAALATYTPQIVDSLFTFLIGLLNGLAKHIPGLIQAAVNILMSVFTGVVDALKGIDTNTLLEGIVGIGLLAGMMLVLSSVAALVPGAMAGVLGIGVVLAELALVLAAIGGLAQIPGLDWLINEGGELLQSIGRAIGGFVGGIVGGLMEGVTGSLPNIGTDLSDFMTNIQPFINGVRNIDVSTMEGIKALAGAILALTAANVIDGLTSWFTGGSSFVSFGLELAAFGPLFNLYYQSIKGVDGSVVSASANAALALAEMATKLPNQGGVASWFAGENSLSKFADELVIFGPKMKAYADSVKGLDAEAVTSSANAALVLADMAAKLPNQGGVASWFAGDNRLSVFAKELEEFGPMIKTYSDSVKGIDAESVSSSANAALTIADMATKLPNQGGVASWFAGENTLSMFAEELAVFGPKIKEYADSVKGIDSEAVTCSVNAAKALSDMASALPNQGGMASWFSGDNKLSDFGDGLADFGKAIKSYNDEVAGINTAKIASATAQLTRLVDLASGMSGINFSSLGSFGNALGKIGKAGIDSFIKAFTNSKEKISKVGKGMIDTLVKSVESNTRKLEKTFSSLSASAASAAREKYLNFYNAGSYLVSGFAKGISENTWRAEAKAKAMANAAEKAAKDALDINSPSKVFRKLGSSVPEGFAMGIGMLGRMVERSSISMARTAIDNVRSSISHIADIVNGDIDVQPTIRPVVDLDDVRSSAGAINRLLNFDSHVGAVSNTRAISAIMNRQNGVNGDVVSAIDKLGKKMNNLGNTTYNSINGITYDDGSNVAAAIEELVRYATIGGRT